MQKATRHLVGIGARGSIAVILASFLALGLLYSVVDPVFEASDEMNHYPYVKHLADGNGLPVQQPGVKTLWEQEGSQPPLYYILAAAATFWIDTSDLPDLLYKNPHAMVGVPLARDNKNMFIHTEREAFPWRGTALAVHLIRLLSVGLGALTVWLTYRLACTIFPGNEPLALGAAALVAFNPMFLFISASVNNDNPVVTLSTLGLLLAGRISQGLASKRTLVALGFVCGLAALSKLSALGLIPLGCLAWAMCVLRSTSPAVKGGTPTSAGDSPPGPPSTGGLGGGEAGEAGGADVGAGGLLPKNLPLKRGGGEPPDNLRVPPRLVLERSEGIGGSGGLIGGLRARALWSLIEGWLLVLVPATLVAGWWYLRNWQLYRDPTGLNVFLDIAGRRPTPPSLIDLWNEFEGFRINYWGLFGGVNVLLDPTWLYTLFDALTLTALLGLVVLARRAWMAQGDRHTGRQVHRYTRSIFSYTCVPVYLCTRLLISLAPLLLLLVWIALVFGGLIRWTQQTAASQGRLLFPAISALAVLLALGLTSLVPVRRQGIVVAVLAVALALIAALAPFRSIIPAYARPPILAPASLPSDMRRVDITYGEVMRLIGFQVNRDSVKPGESFDVTLFWQSLAPVQRDYSIYIHVFGRDGQRIGKRDSYPGRGTYPTRLWRMGDVIKDTFEVPIAPDAMAPVAALLEVGLYDLATMQNLPASDGSGQPLGRPVLGRVKVAARQQQPPLVMQNASATFGDMIRLAGYDLDTTTIHAGNQVPIALNWEVVAQPDADYTVFVHLIGPDGRPLSQGDGPPLNGDYPTSFWSPGEYLRDTHVLTIRRDVPAGQYPVAVGLYQLASGVRLPVASSEGMPAGDSVVVGTIRVEPAQ